MRHDSKRVEWMRMGCLLALAFGCNVSSSGHGTQPRGRPAPSPIGTLAGVRSALTIDANGGTATTPDRGAAVTLAPNTVSAPIDITIDEMTNTAPGGVGVAYRIGPERSAFDIPVTLTFRPDLTTHALANLTIATQDGTGYWIRPPDVVRDPFAGTLAVATTHFSDWAVITGTTTRDLRGSFSLESSLDVPFTAAGEVTLNLAGEDATGSYYLAWGTITLSTVTAPGATCTTSAPALPLLTNIAELRPQPNPTRFEWGVSGHWVLDCTPDGGGVPFTQLLTTAFDTVGVNDIGCARAYVGTPVIGPDRASGSYAIDCGPRGRSMASWDFQTQ